jgi:hypothetical protein
MEEERMKLKGQSVWQRTGDLASSSEAINVFVLTD